MIRQCNRQVIVVVLLLLVRLPLAVQSSKELSFYVVSGNPDGLAYAQGSGAWADLGALLWEAQDRPTGTNGTTTAPVVEILVFSLPKGCSAHSQDNGCDWTKDLGLGIRKEGGSPVWCSNGSFLIDKTRFPGQIFPTKISRDGSLYSTLFPLKDNLGESIVAISYCQQNGPERIHVSGHISWEETHVNDVFGSNYFWARCFLLVIPLVLYGFLITIYACQINLLDRTQHMILATIGQSFVASLVQALCYGFNRQTNASTLENTATILALLQFTTARSLLVWIGASGMGSNVNGNHNGMGSRALVILSTLALMNTGTQLWEYTKPTTVVAARSKAITNFALAIWAWLALGWTLRVRPSIDEKAKYFKLSGILLVSSIIALWSDGIPILVANKYLLPVVTVAVLWRPQSKEVKYQGMPVQESDTDANLELRNTGFVDTDDDDEEESCSSMDDEECSQCTPASE